MSIQHFLLNSRLNSRYNVSFTLKPPNNVRYVSTVENITLDEFEIIYGSITDEICNITLNRIVSTC